jgi:hypothetical protein
MYPGFLKFDRDIFLKFKCVTSDTYESCKEVPFFILLLTCDISSYSLTRRFFFCLMLMDNFCLYLMYCIYHHNLIK